jgi:hypothetical protein
MRRRQYQEPSLCADTTRCLPIKPPFSIPPRPTSPIIHASSSTNPLTCYMGVLVRLDALLLLCCLDCALPTVLSAAGSQWFAVGSAPVLDSLGLSLQAQGNQAQGPTV